MDTRAHERQRQALHGLVSAAASPRAGAWWRRPALLAGIAGGLVRAGVAVPTMRCRDLAGPRGAGCMLR